MWVISNLGSIHGSCNLKRMSGWGSRKYQSNNTLSHAPECDRGKIIYGIGWLLLKIHSKFLQYWEYHHYVAKKRSEVSVDRLMRSYFWTTKEITHLYIYFEDKWSREGFYSLHWCLQGGARWSPNPRMTCNMLWIQEYEWAWKKLCHSWLGDGIHCASTKNVEE